MSTAENAPALIRSAGRLFRTKGIDGVGVADICKAAGLTHGARIKASSRRRSIGPAQLLSRSAAKTFRRAANRRRLIAKKEAINFAMSLDVPQRRTVQLHLPGGDIAELPIIEQMYAQHQKNK